MKKIMFLIALLVTSIGAFAQSRGTYGTLQNNLQVAPTVINARGTVVSKDTLKGADTTILQWTLNKRYATTFSINLNTVTDSVTATTYLEASQNGTTWESITGITSLCTTCIGASKATTKALGNNTYEWSVGLTDWLYFRLRTVSTGNSAQRTAVTGFATISY